MTGTGVKTLVGTPDPQKWQEVLPMWVLDMLDEYSFKDWRKHFSHADFDQTPTCMNCTVWFKLPNNLGLGSEIFQRWEAEVLYNRRIYTLNYRSFRERARSMRVF